MTNAEAIERLENDCCKSRVYCELYPDACQKEECEIYMAIEALERTSNAHPTHECVEPTHECDTINRGEALNLVLDVCNDVMDECETVTGICGEEVYTDVREVDAILKCNKRIRNGIRRLPSEPVGNSDMMRPKGEWDYSDDMYETRVCSACGFDTEDYKEYNYCPNCGANMRGGDQ